MKVLYERWHAAISANAFLSPAMYFQTNAFDPKLSNVVVEMRQHRLEMSRYLCEKIALEPSLTYEDAKLLHRLAGINLIHTDDMPISTQDIGKNIQDLFATFKREWIAGVYRDPGVRIAQLCKERLPKESEGKIAPLDLLPIRRYGVFAIPALVQQVKDNDSMHAFAALMMTLEEVDTYTPFFQNRRQNFPTKQAKLEKVKQSMGRFRAEQKHETELMKKSFAVLGD
jgi:hypothetical protein